MGGLAALQYSRDGFDTRTGTMMGRRMAGETLLKAWIAHSGADPLTGWGDNDRSRAAFVAHTRELGVTGPIVCAGQGDETPLIDAGALWLADPSLAQYAWHRRWGAQDRWSLIGITHTISSHAANDRIAAMLIAPVQRWDALICTSRAVKTAVMTLLEAEADYLAARLGAQGCAGPELPIIPLGVSCDAIAPDPAARARWRGELGIPDDAVAILQFGRMALHMKSHPLPLYRALEQAAARGGPPLHLILAGQFINPEQDAMHHRLAAHFAGIVTTHFVDGARPDAGGVRAAADIGTLLSDNIQESFGLAPVELLAAGLPVIGSDWDGLRDTIAHGVTGFLVDTVLPKAGSGEAIARRHAAGIDGLAHYLGATAQATAIDIAQAADAFAALATDPARRRAMGAAARARALRLYDWPVVIAAYRALLDHLAERRRAGTGERAPRAPGKPAVPARMDPFAIFAAYPTMRLEAGTRLDRAPGASATVADIPGGLAMTMLVRTALPSVSTLDAMIAHVGGGPVTLIDLLDAFPGLDRRTLVAGIGWLLKFGFVVRV